MNVSCGGQPGSSCQPGIGDSHEYAAVVYLYAADLILEQSAGPSASSVSGELASAPAVSGTSDVAFDASDPGAGVWEATFSVDGNVVQSTVPDEEGGRCRNVGQTTDGLAAFLYLQPCPPTESVDVPFNTTAVSNGAHHLIVSVIDAAGNSAPVLDREIDVNNPVPAHPGPANGTNASSEATLTARWASTTKEHLTSGWGKTETITGRLTAPGGVPIGGALLDVTATPAYTGAKASALASPKTGADGRFELRLPRGESSRTLRIAYRAHIGDALPVATRTLTLGVRAGVSLSVAPHTTSVGRSIFFKGVLKGAPQPAGGKQLVLEARSPGGEWIEFNVIRARAHGRYRASYRFKFPGPARYQFRVLCKQEADFPFAEGASNLVGVRER
ncbi:MAG TPA: carboxypeptidase-like regulatory domain-containing protein [Solirubrobacteraceae bacterium]